MAYKIPHRYEMWTSVSIMMMIMKIISSSDNTQLRLQYPHYSSDTLKQCVVDSFGQIKSHINITYIYLFSVFPTRKKSPSNTGRGYTHEHFGLPRTKLLTFHLAAILSALLLFPDHCSQLWVINCHCYLNPNVFPLAVKSFVSRSVPAVDVG